MNTPADVISDVLVLAAMERAERHRARGHSDIPIWTILEHLDIPRRSAIARRVRSQIGALELAGSLTRSRRHGVQVWALTPIGRRRLQRSLRAGTVAQLPESPQHRAWRNARTAGAQELDRFRASLREALDEGARLLSAEPSHRASNTSRSPRTTCLSRCARFRRGSGNWNERCESRLRLHGTPDARTATQQAASIRCIATAIRDMHTSPRGWR